MIAGIRPLSERIKDINLAEVDDTSLTTDVAAAARNRANIERMRMIERKSLNDNVLEDPLTPEMVKVLGKGLKIEKEEVKIMPDEAIVKSKAQLLYEQHAKEAFLVSPWKALGQKIKDVWELKADPNYIPKVTVSVSKPVAKLPNKLPIKANNFISEIQTLPKLELPSFNPQWRDEVKIAWFMVFESINK